MMHEEWKGNPSQPAPDDERLDDEEEPPSLPDPTRAWWIFRIGLAIGLAGVVILSARVVRLIAPCWVNGVGG